MSILTDFRYLSTFELRMSARCRGTIEFVRRLTQYREQMKNLKRRVMNTKIIRVDTELKAFDDYQLLLKQGLIKKQQQDKDYRYGLIWNEVRHLTAKGYPKDILYKTAKKHENTHWDLDFIGSEY